MTNAHTLGPWRICYTKFDNLVVGFHITCDRFGSLRPIAESGCDGWTFEQLIAHANLIAAAPDLLAALQMVTILASSDTASAKARIEKMGSIARAAIAKAEGR